VRALVRNPKAAVALSQIGVELIPGDLENRKALTRLLSGCDAVVHSAGAVRGANQADFDRTNVTGTSELIAATKRHAPEARFIMLSSMAALEPQLSWYAYSKFKAEQLLVKNAGLLDWAALRPAAVYGPGDKEMLPIFRLMARGITPVPGETQNRLSVLHVDDLVRAILALLDVESAPCKAMNICDGCDGGYSWDEITLLAEDVWHRRIRILKLPKGLTNLVARINLRLAWLFNYAPMLTPPKLRELRHPNWVINNRDLEAAINWQPRIQLRKGLEELAL
jgi:2-alkyl-3-oxoalkanoate reductase